MRKHELSKTAQKIINKILYCTIATANKKGRPWNSPVYCTFDKNYNFYWVSSKNAQHSKNIRENNNVFVVIYDSTMPEGTGEGVYIQGKAYELTDKKDAQYGLNYLAKRGGSSAPSAQHFLGNMPQRVYKITPQKMWMNGEKEIKGRVVDMRIPMHL